MRERYMKANEKHGSDLVSTFDLLKCLDAHPQDVRYNTGFFIVDWWKCKTNLEYKDSIWVEQEIGTNCCFAPSIW